MLFPVVQLTPEVLALHVVALPRAEIDVADRQVGQGRRLPCAERAVQSRQLTKENAGRSRIEHEVVHGAHEHVLLAPETYKAHAEDRTARKIERSPRFLCDGRVYLRVATFDVASRQVIDGHHESVRRLHGLVRDPAVRWKYRTKRIVAAHDFTDRAAQRLDVEGTLQIDNERNVVDGAIGRELIEKPESLLRERQRGA